MMCCCASRVAGGVVAPAGRGYPNIRARLVLNKRVVANVGHAVRAAPRRPTSPRHHQCRVHGRLRIDSPVAVSTGAAGVLAGRVARHTTDVSLEHPWCQWWRTRERPRRGPRPVWQQRLVHRVGAAGVRRGGRPGEVVAISEGRSSDGRQRRTGHRCARGVVRGRARRGHDLPDGAGGAWRARLPAVITSNPSEKRPTLQYKRKTGNCRLLAILRSESDAADTLAAGRRSACPGAVCLALAKGVATSECSAGRIARVACG